MNHILSYMVTIQSDNKKQEPCWWAVKPDKEKIMTQFTEHVSKKFYNRAVKEAKEIKQMHFLDPSPVQAKLEFTYKMLDIRDAYMNGIRDMIDYKYLTIIDFDFMELSTELDNVIGFIANNLYEQLKLKESK